MADSLGLAELVAPCDTLMTTPDMQTLAVQGGDVLGAWGASLNLSRELTPLKSSADGKTLVDRAVYVENATGGYYSFSIANSWVVESYAGNENVELVRKELAA